MDEGLEEADPARDAASVVETNASISYYFAGVLGELRRCVVTLQACLEGHRDFREPLTYMLALMFGSQRFLEAFRKHEEQNIRWRMHEMRNRFTVISGNAQLLLSLTDWTQSSTDALDSMMWKWLS